MKPIIYADNAATTPLSQAAFVAMQPYFSEYYGNPSQPYTFSGKARSALKNARAQVAACIGASPEEIYFTSGGSESDNWAIKGSAFADDRKRRTITSSIEHHAVLNACRAIERMEQPVTYLPVTREGIITPETLSAAIDYDTRLVSVMTANNEIGTIEPIRALSDVAHSHGAMFHTDAVQAVGHIPVNVNDMGVDMLSASAHKFGGPRGVGFLYIRSGVNIAPLIDGGAQEAGMRAGTENVAGIVGMAAALEESCANMHQNAERLRACETALLDGLHGLDCIRNGAPDRLPGNVSLSFKGAEGEMLLHRLDLMGICISTGSACDSKRTQLSHVIAAIAVPEAYAYGTIRVSFGAGNSVDEAQTIADSIGKIIGKS